MKKKTCKVFVVVSKTVFSTGDIEYIFNIYQSDTKFEVKYAITTIYVYNICIFIHKVRGGDSNTEFQMTVEPTKEAEDSKMETSEEKKVLENKVELEREGEGTQNKDNEVSNLPV